MVKLRSLILLFVVILLASACQVNAQTGALPTLVSFPTETATIASDTPTITPTFTATFTPSNTPTATNTATATETFTPSATFTPTITATPTVTRTPRPSATSTLLPTNTATLTPIPTRTPNAPVIELFDANQLTVPLGGPISLRWIADADAMLLEIMEPSGVVLQTFPVDLIGSYTSNVPSSGTAVIYRLTAVRGNEEIRAALTVNLGVACNLNWFFDNASASTSCPLSPPRQNPLTFQQFQTGYMFRTVINGSDRVCGIQIAYGVYSCYDALSYIGPPPATPAPGYLIPSVAFEEAYYNRLATGGFWYNVIGWGTTTATSASVQIQDGDDGLVYIQLPIGIYAFDSNLNNSNRAIMQITQP
jgi:cytoskeletal protein RodZ